MCSIRTIFVIDDDPALRDSVCALVRSMGWQAQSFASAEEFLASYAPDQRGVVVTDLRMPGMSGLELQEELARRNHYCPLILLTAYARTPITVRAMQAGAVTILDKPYQDNDLWEAIRAALDKEDVAWTAKSQRSNLLARVGSLTPEERRIAELIISGYSNKSIALELDLSVRTIEKRRQSLMTKMAATSVGEMVCHFLAATQ